MRVAIYARVSTEQQEKQKTIKSQLQDLREFARKNNLTVFEEYIDEGYSGELLSRPALDKLRDDAQNKLFDSVLVHSPDRLSRKYIYHGLVQEELKKYGINIIFLNRPDNKDTPEDNLLYNIQGAVAEYEKAKILERTRRGKIHKAKSGLLVGSIPPYGYKYVKDAKGIGYYKVINEEAEVVRLIFDLFINKRLSIRTIAKELTERDLQPRKGKRWGTSTIHKILRNETYTGITYYNKNISIETDERKTSKKYRRTRNTGRCLRPFDQWIAIKLPNNAKIIEKGTFDSAQGQLKRNSELSPRNMKNHYLLKGLVRCGKCGSPFYGTPCHGKLFYRCGNRDKTFPLPRECKASIVLAETLERVVWDKLCEALKKPHLIVKQVAKLKEKSLRENNMKKDVDSIEKKLVSIEKEENRLLNGFREGVITIDQLRIQMAEVKLRSKQLEEEKKILATKQQDSFSPTNAKKTITDYCRSIEKRLDTLSKNFDGKKYLLSLAVNKIELEGKMVRIKGIIPTSVQPSLAVGNIASISCS
jgi:site-specific DNA recombinase